MKKENQFFSTVQCKSLSQTDEYLDQLIYISFRLPTFSLQLMNKNSANIDHLPKLTQLNIDHLPKLPKLISTTKVSILLK